MPDAPRPPEPSESPPCRCREDLGGMGVIRATVAEMNAARAALKQAGVR